MRLADWPRMPFLSDELTGWINEHLAILGVEEIAIYGIEAGRDDDERRVLVATEIGLIDYHYSPQASTARFAIEGRMLPWQAVRGVDLRVETFRLWALEHRTRWSLTILKPRFQAATEDPSLRQGCGGHGRAVRLAAIGRWDAAARGAGRGQACTAAATGGTPLHRSVTGRPRTYTISIASPKLKKR